MDAFGKEYVAFEITVKNGLLTWQLSKRYSDFAAMHEKLKKHEQQQQQQQLLQQQEGQVSSSPLPDLPPKLFQGVQGRQERLEAYLQQVVDRPMAMENPHVLAFLGILSSMSANLSSLDADPPQDTTTTTTIKKKKRQILHISALKKTLQMGDIALFQCAHSLAGLQRTVTRAEWDHGTWFRWILLTPRYESLLSAWLSLYVSSFSYSYPRTYHDIPVPHSLLFPPPLSSF